MAVKRAPANAYAEEAYALLEHPRIPYVRGGSSLKGMDCQGMCEYILRCFGIEKNWSGSNAMYRDMLWVGTPEECKEKFGCVPDGAWLFILEQDGCEPAKYKPDGIGNASHVGVKTGRGKGAIHASASRGCVAESAFADKTVRNGGWNRVGLCSCIDYGAEVEAALGMSGDADKEADTEQPTDEEVALVMTLAKVATTGGILNVRKSTSTRSTDLGDIPNGATVEVLEKTSDSWWKVRYGELEGYCATEYLIACETVDIILEKDTASALLNALNAALGVDG